MNGKEFWTMYVKDKEIYRVISEEYVPLIKKEGIDPCKSPFQKKVIKDIKLLFNLMIKLEKNGIIYKEVWRDGPRKASEIIKISKDSMSQKRIDFVANYDQAIKFKSKWKGGALINSIFNYSNFLLKQNISQKEKELVEKLLRWSTKKRKYKNRVVVVKGDGSFFETAKLLTLPLNKKKKLMDSPYGSYENFEKKIKGIFEKYEPYLTLKELSYIQVFDKIYPDEIVKII